MPSNLASGNGLDGVIVLVAGPFSSLGTINAGQCAANASNTKFNETVAPTIYQSIDSDLVALHTATSGSARQAIFLNAGGLQVTKDLKVGDEISLGDQGARDDGDLHATLKHSEVIATGWTMLRDGTWVSPTGAVVATLPQSLGTGISLGADTSTGVYSYYSNYGVTGVAEFTLPR